MGAHSRRRRIARLEGDPEPRDVGERFEIVEM